MFFSRKAHDLIVAELRNRIVELEKERDFYREKWTKSRGAQFPSSKARPSDLSLPLFDRSSTAQESPKPVRLDDDWTLDDRDLFKDWAAGLPPGVNAEDEWKRLYGSQPPLIVLTV